MIDIKLLRAHEVRELTGLKRTTIHNLVKSGQFPAPVDVAGNRSAWYAHEVHEWIKTRPRKGQRAAACATVPTVPAVTIPVPARATRPRNTTKRVSVSVPDISQTVANMPTSQTELPL